MVHLTQLFSQEPKKFISRLFSGQIVDTDTMYDLIQASPDVVIPELIEIFQGDDSSRALIAGDLLSRFGKAAIAPFIVALRNETDEDRKIEITSFLTRIGPDAIPDLVSLLTEPDCAPYAMAALSAIGEPAVPALIPFLEDQDQTVQHYAIAALTKIGQPAASALMSLMQEKESLVPLISRILARMGGAALPELMQSLKHCRLRGRREAVGYCDHVTYHRDRPLKPQDMRTLFTIADPTLTSMFERIFISKGEQILGPLLHAVTYESTVPPMAASFLLHCDRRPKPQPSSFTIHSTGDRKRIALLHVLGILKDPSSMQIMYDALKDPDQEIRMTAIKELGKFGREALGPLTDAMHDPDPYVRAAAVESLGDIGLPVLDQLITALKDPDGHIRAAALKGISKIGEAGQFMLVQTLDDPIDRFDGRSRTFLRRVGGNQSIQRIDSVTSLQRKHLMNSSKSVLQVWILWLKGS
jgi:HEAT repeat protein